MASSSVTYTSGTNNFNITFPYLRDKHVVVMVGGTLYDVDDNYFTIDASSSTKKVVLTNPVSEGTTIKILRMSLGKNNDLYNDDNLGTLVDFVDGSVLTEKQQDESYLHNYYLNQESLEGNLKLGTPILDSDPATKGYVDGIGISGGGGSVTSVTAGNGLSGGTITTSGTVSIPTSGGDLNINSGKVGIGLDSDTDYALKVAAKMCVYGSGSDGTELRVEDPTATSKVYLKGATSAVLDLQDEGTTSGSQRFRIQSNNGNLKFLQLNDDASSVTNTLMQLKAGGKITLDSLPTSDPSVTGELWNNGGVVAVSGSSGFCGGSSSGGGTVTYLSSPSTLLDVSGLNAQANNNTYVTYTIPSSVPSTAGSVVLRVITSADEDEVTVHAKTSSWSERKVGWSYGPNNSDDASGDVNTFLIPYSSTVDIKYNGTGSGSAEIAQVYVDGYMTGGSSNSSISKYDSGWVTTDGSTTVANGATLTFTHGLSTSALNAQIWVSGASDGSYPYLMDIQETFSNTSMVGAGITNITSTQITIQFSDSGYVYMNSSGQNATSTVNGHDAASSGYVPFTNKYIKLVAIG